MSETAKIEVVLGEYKGIAVPKVKVEVTAQEVESELARAKEMTAQKVNKETPAEMGDEVVIDFTGYINDVAFEGGAGNDFALTLGSGTFIPGFEEQLVGATAGGNVDVTVSFPENYHAAEYAGKPAVFKCVVKEIHTTQVPELSDETVAKISPCKTVEEFKQYVENEIRTAKEQEAAVARENAIVEKIMETTTVTIPQSEIDTAAENLKQSYLQQLTQGGHTVEQFLEYNNMTMEQFTQSAKTQAETMLRGQSMLAEVAKVEELIATEEEYIAELQNMALNYRMEVEKLEETLGEKGKELLRQDIAGRKALDLIVSASVEG